MMRRESVDTRLRQMGRRGPAVITGAASGLGRALALELAELGVEVVVSDIDGPGVVATSQRCRALGGRAHHRILDVTDRDAVHAHARWVVEEIGVPELVVNNAGVAMVGLIENESDDDARHVFAVNLGGVRNGTDAFLPVMDAGGRGHLVNVASAFGLSAAPLQGSYSASKFAVRGYTESVQADLLLRGSGVGVHCVCPGAIRTAVARNARYTDAGVRRRVVTVFDRVLPATRPAEAARTVLAGVVGNSPRIVIGLDGRLLDLVSRVTGNAHQRPMARLLAPITSRMTGP